MEPLMFVMAILGCGESDAAAARCGSTPQGTPRAAEGGRMRGRDRDRAAPRDDDLLYPNVVAQCRRAGAAVQIRPILRGSAR